MPAWMFPAMGAAATKAAGTTAGASLMSYLPGIGSVLGGAGSLLSGLGFGSGSTEFNANKYGDMIKEGMTTRMRIARKYGKRYGFHPLVALGINPGSGSGAWHRGPGSDFARMGQGLDRISKGVAEFDPNARELNRLKLEQERARLKNMNLQNVGLMKQVNDLDTQTGPPASNIKVEELPLKHPSYASGDEEGRAVKALYQLYRHPDNTIIKIPAEDAADYLSESKIDAAILQTKRWFRNLTRGVGGRLSTNYLRKIRDELDDMETFMRSNRELRPDEYLQYSPQLGLPIVQRSWAGKKKMLFRETTNIYKRNLPRYGGMYFRKN